jgi:hypothetical protein
MRWVSYTLWLECNVAGRLLESSLAAILVPWRPGEKGESE